MNVNETKTSEPTPEQLLKMLDLQMNSMRSNRSRGSNRTGVRVASIVVVLAVLAGALFFLMTLLDTYRTEKQTGASGTHENAER